MADHGSHATPASAPLVLREEELQIRRSATWSRLPLVGGVVAAIGLGGGFALGAAHPEHLWRAWLVAALFVLTIALGALFFVLVQHATQAGWSVSVRRLAENAMATIPFIAILFVPLVANLGDLFHWSHPEAVAADPLLAHKAPFLNPPFFVARTVLYFVVWSTIALWFFRQSRLQDATGDHELTRRMRKASAPALILYSLTVTFAAFDWLMSLDPHWYSTIFGVYVFTGCLVAAFAFLAIVAIAKERAGLLRGAVTVEHWNELGKLLFAFVAFWAYIGFSQYFLIWYGNLPEETTFFGERLTGAWRWASIALAIGHFVLPFFLLMPRTVKRHAAALVAASLWMLAMHALDLYWLAMPGLHAHAAVPFVVELATLAGAVGGFLAAYAWVSRRQALVPLRDPRLPEALLFENV